MSPRRKRKERRLGAVIHIFCEGSETEPNYIKGYARELRLNRRCELPNTRHSDPSGLVDEAIALKKVSPKNDLFFVVCDLEDLSQGKRLENLRRAFQKAADQEIYLILSCVSFEVWILLHHTAKVKAFQDAAGALRELRTWMPDYDKGDADLFRRLRGQVTEARKRSATLVRRHIGSEPEKHPFEFNPYCNMHELLDAIDRLPEE